jgi:hypothetical protein
MIKYKKLAIPLPFYDANSFVIFLAVLHYWL